MSHQRMWIRLEKLPLSSEPKDNVEESVDAVLECVLVDKWDNVDRFLFYNNSLKSFFINIFFRN